MLSYKDKAIYLLWNELFYQKKKKEKEILDVRNFNWLVILENIIYIIYYIYLLISK